MGSWLPLAAALLLRVPAAEALAEPELCYVLDGVLFLYGIVLTVLYCRLKFVTRRALQRTPMKPEEGIYTGLSTEHQETYEMLQHKS
ncbi:high affinity immunoglobulin epsilon receptor subunit gamma [Cyrtonyx montezumae]|uniref:high affinity immunoglobulin epsilon receptor subunit gamma n=1 Tax=Cyrtonyx montezumae TaxID=9017 RepID=UPI0032DAE974